MKQEIEKWIEEGILILGTEDATFRVLVLMMVVQPTKNKVRTVLDYHELNEYLSCHSGGEMIDECRETLRK